MKQGKAGSLEFLKSLGLNVPDFQVIPHDQIVSWGDSGLYQNLLSHLKKNNRESISAAAKDFLLTVKVPALNVESDRLYAVRSSASLEDSPEHSFAGIFDTLLFQEDLSSGIKEVWSSLFSERAWKYCQDKKIPWNELRMNIIIQEMIPADKSGVLFQANPDGKITEQLIVAGLGLGQGIVDEQSDTDRYLLEGDQIKESVIEKKRYYLGHVDKRIQRLEIQGELQSVSVLNHKEIEQLLSASTRIATHVKQFMDIEFSFFQDKLYLLQARPITTLAGKGLVKIFDNSNIAENYPGQSSPLTFSGLARGYSKNFQNLLRFLGYKEDEFQHLMPELEQLVGYWGGQIYYNLNSWYSIYTLLPFGTEKAIKSFNEMVGINSSSILKIPERRLLNRLRILLRILPKFLVFFFKEKKYHKDYQKEFKALHEKYLISLQQASETFELLDLIQRLDNEYLSIIKIPLFNDFFSSLLNSACRQLSKKIAPEEGENLYNDLLSHREELESSRAIYSLIELSELAQKDPALLQALEDQGDLASYPEFEEKLTLHFARFGDRSQWEMKIEIPTAREKPELTLKLIAEYARAGMSRELQRQRERDKSQAAKRKFAKLFWRRPFTSLLFRFLFKRCTSALSFREDSRFDRVRFKGLSRRLILKLGERLQKKKAIEETEDIFFFTFDELRSLSFDSFGGDYWKELIALRKRHLTQSATLKLEDRIIVNDLMGVKKFSHDPIKYEASSIAGIPCSGGEIESICEVVLDVTTAPNLSGKILVAERTDPAWGYFFVGVKGIIIEKGSMLSHAAIISRELGIPCIINVKNATSIFKSGMKLKMNGDKGVIEVVEPTCPTTEKKD